MRAGIPFLFLLAACSRSSPPAPPVPASKLSARGIVLAGDDPLPGARVKGSGGVSRGKEVEKFDLGPVRSGPDGSFTLALPERLVQAMDDRATWGWWVRFEGDHDELLVCHGVHADSREKLEGVRLQFVGVEPDIAKEVRERLESLRTSPLKKHFRHGTDPVDGYGEAREVFEEIHESAVLSRSARETVRKYLKDDDEALQALAYEALTLVGECPDEPPRPPQPRTAAQARALLDWAFTTIRTSKHGGHLEVGVDLDDLCSRCQGLWSDVEMSLWQLTRPEALEALKKYEKEDGQVRVLQTLALEELRPEETPEKEKPGPGPTPDAPLAARPEGSGDWIAVYRYPGTLLTRPQSGASPVAFLPPWLRLEDAAWSPDGKRLVGRGGPSIQSDLWVIDLERNLASRATWGAIDWRPQWFPDGRRILFSRNAKNGQDLWVLEVEGFKTSRLREIGAGVDHFALDPSGTKVAYVTRDPDGLHGLHVLDLPTGRVEKLSEGRLMIAFPEWSLDGRQVAFVRDGRLCLVNLPAGPVREIALEAGTCAGLARSPDGRLAVTTYDGPFNRARYGRLWVLDADGSRPRMIAKREGPVAHSTRPDWSPEGKRISFVALEEEKPVLFVVSDDGGRLVRDLEYAGHPRWRPAKQ